MKKENPTGFPKDAGRLAKIALLLLTVAALVAAFILLSGCASVQQENPPNHPESGAQPDNGANGTAWQGGTGNGMRIPGGNSSAPGITGWGGTAPGHPFGNRTGGPG